MEVTSTARLVNRPVAVHCVGTSAIKMAIRCGVRTIEHSTLMDDECIRMYLASDQSFPIPTITALFSASKNSPSSTIRPHSHCEYALPHRSPPTLPEMAACAALDR